MTKEPKEQDDNIEITETFNQPLEVTRTIFPNNRRVIYMTDSATAKLDNGNTVQLHIGRDGLVMYDFNNNLHFTVDLVKLVETFICSLQPPGIDIFKKDFTAFVKEQCGPNMCPEDADFGQWLRWFEEFQAGATYQDLLNQIEEEI